MGQKFYEYWNRLLVQNPNLGRDDIKMTISVESFKKQLAKAFEEGRKHPLTSRKDAADDFAKFGRKESVSDIFSAFGDMFGGGK